MQHNSTCPQDIFVLEVLVFREALGVFHDYALYKFTIDIDIDIDVDILVFFKVHRTNGLKPKITSKVWSNS